MEYKEVIQEMPNGRNILLIPIRSQEEEEKQHQVLYEASVKLLRAWEECKIKNVKELKTV